MEIVKPNRRGYSCEQLWEAPPEKTFPLLCPVRETEWVPEWAPRRVVSTSGVMEPGCLFVEPAEPYDAIWVLVGYEEGRWIDLYRTAPGVTVSRFTIRLEPVDGGRSRAELFYQHTSLSEDGDEVVDAFTAERFNEEMGHFEAAINHYLTTGRMIEG